MNQNKKACVRILFAYFKPSCLIQSICPIVGSPYCFRPAVIVNLRSWATVLLIKSKIESNFL